MVLLRRLKDTVKGARALVRRRYYEFGAKEVTVSKSSALVVAPHPDDETLGAGGLIALKRAAGVEVRVLFLTAGEASHASCAGIDSDHVATKRREQAVGAAHCLGLGPQALTWQKLRDGHIPRKGDATFEAAVQGVMDVIHRFSPGEIFVPHPHDGWDDHEAASNIVAHAVRRSNLRPDLFFYLVWAWYSGPSPFGRYFPREDALVVDIRPVLARKCDAMDVYLNGHVAPCGNPYCGKLPKAVIACASKPTEIFFREAEIYG